MTPISPIGLLPILLLVFTMTACSWTGKDGTRHTLVLGVAVLSTKDQIQGGAIITKTSLCGLGLQRSPAMTGLIVGYSERLLTQIPPRWEGQLSIDKSPGRPLEIQSTVPHRLH